MQFGIYILEYFLILALFFARYELLPKNSINYAEIPLSQYVFIGSWFLIRLCVQLFQLKWLIASAEIISEIKKMKHFVILKSKIKVEEKNIKNHQYQLFSKPFKTLEFPV